jgi:hypothetical protein
LFWSYFDRSNASVLSSIDLRQGERKKMLVAQPQEENRYGEGSEMAGRFYLMSLAVMAVRKTVVDGWTG